MCNFFLFSYSYPSFDQNIRWSLLFVVLSPCFSFCYFDLSISAVFHQVSRSNGKLSLSQISKNTHSRLHVTFDKSVCLLCNFGSVYSESGEAIVFYNPESLIISHKIKRRAPDVKKRSQPIKQNETGFECFELCFVFACHSSRDQSDDVIYYRHGSTQKNSTSFNERAFLPDQITKPHTQSQY